MRSLLLAVVLDGLMLPARAETPASGCNVNIDQVRLANPLSHIAKKLVNFDPITIVAIGSSSTAGAGASSPVAT
jgi:acyl-CoA thioesterase-1